MTELDTTYTIRRVRPSDLAALTAFYAALSPESRRARFMAFGAAVGNVLAQRFCTLDHTHEEGFVAVESGDGVATGGAAPIVGHLCLADAGEGRLEVGVAVADEVQGRGVGRHLFEAALEWAHDHGVEEFVASAFADNTRVLRLLSSAPHGAHVKYQAAGVVEVRIPLRGPLPRDLTVPAARFANGRRRGRSTRRRHEPIHFFWLRRPANGASATIARSANKSSRH